MSWRTARLSRGVLVGVALLCGLLTAAPALWAKQDKDDKSKSEQKTEATREERSPRETPSRSSRDLPRREVARPQPGPATTAPAATARRDPPQTAVANRSQVRSTTLPLGQTQRSSANAAPNRTYVSSRPTDARRDAATPASPYRIYSPGSRTDSTGPADRERAANGQSRDRSSLLQRPTAPANRSRVSAGETATDGDNRDIQIRVPEASPGFQDRDRQRSDQSRAGVRERERVSSETGDQNGRQIYLPERPDRDSSNEVRPPSRERNQVQNRNWPTVSEQVAERSRERAQRAVGVPQPGFRGAEAERKLRVLPTNDGQRVSNSLRTRVTQSNRARQLPATQHVMQDHVGNKLPSNARWLVRSNAASISVSYSNFRAYFGEPTYTYVISPRSQLDYWDGYWDGYADGNWAAQHHRRHAPMVVNFYYPYYYSDPNWVAFWYAGFYPSIYHYWGWSPAWVYPQRVYYQPVEYVYRPATPYRYYYTGYSLDNSGADRAIEDIRRGWFDGEIDSLAYHLTDQLDVQIYFDGKYEYTTSTEDYYAMTVDAMATTHTVVMDFDRPIWISSHEVFYTGRHVFYDPEGTRQTVYVSYRLRRLGGEWYVVSVGSSLDPIQHQYRDFRYT